MKNDLGNKTRRRRVALTARERNLGEHRARLHDVNNGKSPFDPGKTLDADTKEILKQTFTVAIIRTEKEIETLKKRIGHG